MASGCAAPTPPCTPLAWGAAASQQNTMQQLPHVRNSPPCNPLGGRCKPTKPCSSSHMYATALPPARSSASATGRGNAGGGGGRDTSFHICMALHAARHPPPQNPSCRGGRGGCMSHTWWCCRARPWAAALASAPLSLTTTLTLCAQPHIPRTHASNIGNTSVTAAASAAGARPSANAEWTAQPQGGDATGPQGPQSQGTLRGLPGLGFM